MERTSAWEGDFRRVRSDEISRKLPTADVPSFASEDGARNRGSVTTIAAAIALSIEYAPTVFGQLRPLARALTRTLGRQL